MRLDARLYGPSEHVRASTHDTGIVLFQVARGQLFTANRAGAFIWHCLERRLSVDSIADEISRRFHISPDIAHEHVTHFLTQLEEERLVESRDA